MRYTVLEWSRYDGYSPTGLECATYSEAEAEAAEMHRDGVGRYLPHDTETMGHRTA